jgi:hypothetical protein
MSSQNESGLKSFQASGAISAYVAVDVQSDGTITPVAGNASIGIGINQQDIADAGYGQVRLWTAPGTFMIAVTGTAVTPATTYAIVTGGFAGAVNGTFGPASLTAIQSGVASSGIVIEFVSKN